MKKYINICIALAVTILLCGCGDNKTTSKLIGTNVVTASSYVGTSSSQNSFTMSQKEAFTELLYSSSAMLLMVFWPNDSPSTTSSYTLNYTNPRVSGNINLSGPCTVNYSTSTCLLSYMMSLTETIGNYSFQNNAISYVMNGSNIKQSVIFNMDCAPGTSGYLHTTKYEPTSVTVINGSYTVSGAGISQTITVNVTVAIDSDGVNATMYGNIDGQSINQVFHILLI